MDRLPLLPLKCILGLPCYTTRRTPNLLIRQSLNQFIYQRQYTNSKLPVACRTYLNQQSSILISHNLRSKLFQDLYLKKGLLHDCYGTKWIHLSRRCDVIPPLFWLPIGLASKIIAALTGRKYRNWLKTQPPDIQKKHWRGIIAAIASVFILMFTAGTIYYRSHTQKVPHTGRKRFITLTREQSAKVADYETKSFIETYSEADQLLQPNHPKVSKVIGVGNRLIKANQDFVGMKELEWTVYVVKDDDRNAFVLPNGTMFVFTGMIDFVENDDQLAFILAHEMSHALCLHGAEQVSYSKFLDYFVIAFMGAIWLVLPNDGIAIVTNWFYKKIMNIMIDKPYSRMMETEADQVGLHLLAKACYDTREGSVLWHRMSIMDDLKGETRIPEWVSTHPTHMNRVKFIDHLMQKAEEERTKCNCPPLPDVDPRRRAILLRQEANNALVHRATKSNIARAHVDHVRSVGA